jgi:hypothetical protein
MTKILSLTALAIGAALLVLPASSQAASIKLSGLHHDTVVHTIAVAKKKKVTKRKTKKHYAKKHTKKKVVARKKKKPGAKA